jgi:two-component system, OmpR family, sensor histidine kinase KdpD
VRRQILYVALSFSAIALATTLLRLSATTSPTTVALAYLLVVLFVAAVGELWTAFATSIVAMLCFNYFFLPPVGTFTIADPHNWVALFAFLVVSIVASQLSASARSRAKEALDRRLELNRLFDLTRDILLTTEREGALAAIARHVARRFELDTVAICVPSSGGGWQVHHGGASAPVIDETDLDRAFAAAAGAIEFDARTRAYGGHRELDSSSGRLTLAPIRLGTRAIGLMVTGGRELEAGTRDAVAGIVAIALERSQFREERRAAELARQRAELSSALLASLSHDLRTPLTAIRTAIVNMEGPDLSEAQRREQAHVASEQLERLTRLFDELLNMARIDAGGVQAHRSWATPAEIVDAAVAHAASALKGRDLRLDAYDEVAVEVDPSLTSSALAQLLENAARYAPDGPIVVRGWTNGDELRLDVRDTGPGLQPSELEQLFEPFYRGESFRQRIPGTGMGLAITRGFLAAQGGRVWAENLQDGGACFSIAVPGRTRAMAAGS